jgi:pimeloyl-ACP methyl ester carboxylesterase
MTEYLETNGARIAYDVNGSGEPVVLIHAGIANRSQWDAQVDALKDAYRVIRYDTRGFGETETDAVEFSNRADIAALLDHLGERSAHVVGMSRSGSISLDFAIEFPDRVRSLVVAAGGVGGFESPNGTPEETFAESERMWEAKDWERLADWEADFWVDGPGQPSGRADPAVRAKVHDWILTNYRAEKEEGQPIVLDPPANQRLGELRAPLLVMYGTFDEPGTSDAMRHLATTVPGARLEEFESAHMLNLEQPERFNRVLREFLGANRQP